MYREKLAKYFVLTGLLPVAFAGVMLLLTSVSWLLTLPLTPALTVLSFVTTGVLAVIASRHLQIRPVPPVLAWGILLIVMAWISGMYFDTTFDGQWYHQEAIIRMANGWNPIYESVGKYSLDNYAKGPWVWAASLYQITDSIESAKVFNLLFLISAYLVSAGVLMWVTKMEQIGLHLLALGAAAPPVVIGQSLSFYIDNQLFSFTVILAALVFLILRQTVKGRKTFLEWWAFAITIVAILNVKFTALPLVFTAIVILAAGLFFMQGIGVLKPLGITLVFAAGLGMGLAGFQPYMTNLLHHGHPFFPFNDVDITHQLIGLQTPEAFQKSSRMEKLMVSLFSESMNTTHKKPVSKRPFQIKKGELDHYQHPDIRIGGHGPWFSGVLLLAVLLLLTGLFLDRKRVVPAIALFVAVLFSTLLIPEPWWARYTPQLVLLPAVAIVFGMMSRSWVLRIGAYLVLGAMLYNSRVITKPYFQRRNKIRKRISTLLQEHRQAGDSLLLYSGHKHGLATEVRFREAGIPFEVVGEKRDLPCEKPLEMIGSLGVYCVKE